MTVALDEDVARWFRTLGEGYHGRISSAVRIYVLAPFSKEVWDRNRQGDETWGKAPPKPKDE